MAKEPKKYALFAGWDCSPQGGIDDLSCFVESKEEASIILLDSFKGKYSFGWDWAQLVDVKTFKKIYCTEIDIEDVNNSCVKWKEVHNTLSVVR